MSCPISAPTQVCEVGGDTGTLQPIPSRQRSSGSVEYPRETVLGGSAEDNAATMRRILAGEQSGALADMVALNCGRRALRDGPGAQFTRRGRAGARDAPDGQGAGDSRRFGCRLALGLSGAQLRAEEQDGPSASLDMGVKAMGEETFLDRIVGATRRRVAERKEQVSLGALREEVAKASPPRRFADALRPATLGPARLIAEVKRASPSKGRLAEVLDPSAQARAYAEGGAAAVSVLTEPHFFLGSLDDLAAVRSAVDVPILCKDFFLDEYQVYEARAAGADAILLICAMLDDRLLTQLFHLAERLGMDSLIETHSREEVERAFRLEAEARIIGINCRDLKTFTVDTGLAARLGHLVPRSGILVAESGIADRVQATQARARGADAILVGEALMRSPAVAQTTRTLATAPGGAFAGLFGRSETTVREALRYN